MVNDFENKLTKAHHELDGAGIWPSNYNPPIYRLFRALGLKVRPPHYQSFITQTLIMGSIFGPIFGFFMADGTSLQQHTFLGSFVLWVVICGLLFGSVMATMTNMRSRQFGLSNWDEL